MVDAIIILLCGGCILLYVRRRSYKLFVVLLLLIVQFLWWGRPRFTHGSVIEEGYRISQRMEAHRAWFARPSPATQAEADEEDRRLHDYIGRRNGVIFIMILIMDSLGICYFWTKERQWGSWINS